MPSSTEHGEAALVVVGGLQHAAAVQDDVVVGAGIHQQSDFGIGVGIDFQVQRQVVAEGGGRHLLLFAAVLVKGVVGHNERLFPFAAFV